MTNNDTQHLFAQARKHHRAQEHEAALGYYEEVRKKSNATVDMMRHEVDCLFVMQRFEDGIELLCYLKTIAKSQEDNDLVNFHAGKHIARIARWSLTPKMVADNSIKSAPEQLTPPFYISSFGGTATAWLASAISLHPEIVCFHGSRASPPYRTSEIIIGSCRPQTFIDSLIENARACRGQKIFGAVHGYHGLQAREATEFRGGVFTAIIRNPINRINSLSYMHVAQALSISNHNIYKELESLEKQKDNESISKVELAYKRFRNIVEKTIQYDIDLINSLPESHIIKMEDMVSDKNELSRIINLVTKQRVEVTDSYLENAMKIKVNRRVSSINRSYFSPNSWSDNAKSIYDEVVKVMGRSYIEEKYGQFGYDINL